MRRLILTCGWLFFALLAYAQNTVSPDKLYGELFEDVQMSRIFSDSKTFVDCIAKEEPKEIVQKYLLLKSRHGDSLKLKQFVEEHFIIPQEFPADYKSEEKDIVQHIHALWNVLKRKTDSAVSASSLLPLPFPYIVPGGRFREIYYWDSYFTMLGLKESGETETIENMIANFDYLIHTYGHIPNGNRTYYLSRSQPPFFSLMLDILASIKGKQVYVKYQSALEKEYDYWMDRTAPTKHVVILQDGSILNRYYDQSEVPRPESYYEDSMLSLEVPAESRAHLNRNLRSAAESGWDFSSRWFKDGKRMKTIQTTNLLPVDLNALLFHLERTLAISFEESGDRSKASVFYHVAEKRATAIKKYCWSESKKWYVDYNAQTKKQSKQLTLAGMFPFFLRIADTVHMKGSEKLLIKKFLKAGGVVTTLETTGQQWDAPNGWAPLQWITIIGLEQYGGRELAKEIACRWVCHNRNVFEHTGKLMEKYDVVDITRPAGGGEYPSQDGFGWTNGVLLALINRYGL